MQSHSSLAHFFAACGPQSSDGMLHRGDRALTQINTEEHVPTHRRGCLVVKINNDPTWCTAKQRHIVAVEHCSKIYYRRIFACTGINTEEIFAAQMPDDKDQ